MKKIKSNPDVTIIVTVHNAENYIEQCIQKCYASNLREYRNHMCGWWK